ncbi:MAG: lipopolysaccharide biosynthesis protein [Bryobacteraceae bacterium]
MSQPAASRSFLLQSAAATFEQSFGRRGRAAAMTALGNGGAKIVQFAVNLILIRITFRYLGAEEFGIWATLTAFSLLAAFADFGVGNGVLQGIARAWAMGDEKRLSQVMTNGVVMLSGVAGVLVAATFSVGPFVDWNALFHAGSPDAQRNLWPSFAAVLVCLALSLPLGLAQKYNLGVQRGAANGLWLMVGSVLSLAGVWLGMEWKWRMPALLLTYGAGQVAALALTWVDMLLHRGGAKLHRAAVSVAEGKRLASAGSQYFALQLLTAGMMQLPALFIAWRFGVAAVAPYAVANRIAAMVPMALSLAMQPLWPAYAEAHVRGDYAWMKRTFRFSITAAGIAGMLLVSVFPLAMPVLAHWWVGAEAVAGGWLLLSVAIFAAGLGLHSATSTCLNGCGRLRAQFVCQLPALAIGLAGAWTLAPRYGITGIAAVFGVCELALGLLQMVQVRQLFQTEAESAAVRT